MAKNVLLLGSNGQLGKTFLALANQYPNLNLLSRDLPEVDFGSPETIPTLIDRHKPDICINCAAYTAVDLGEDEEELAETINVTAVNYLAESCKANDVVLIHFSTDYVFDGLQAFAYSEQDTPNPQSVYGRTKWEGEVAIQKSGVNHLIFRTSWLYSAYGKNFVKTMLKLGEERDELTVVDDQIGSPTFAGDLAQVVLNWISEGFQPDDYGVYHYSNEGVATWYDFACAVMEYAGLECVVKPVPSAQFPQKATRPSFSLLNKQTIKEIRGFSISHWRESLKKVILSHLPRK